MYELVDLLEGMRGVCLKRLQSALDEFRKKKQRFLVEPAMRDGDTLVRDGPLSLPFRCDAMVVSRDGKKVTPHLFAVQHRWNFSDVQFDRDGLLIDLSSCHWEKVGVSISGDPQAVAASVKRWFEAAFLPPEARRDDEIQNVVHDLSGFRSDAETTAFILDCGTMPVAQMLALFDQLRAAGATRVELSMPGG